MMSAGAGVSQTDAHSSAAAQNGRVLLDRLSLSDPPVWAQKSTSFWVLKLLNVHICSVCRLEWWIPQCSVPTDRAIAADTHIYLITLLYDIDQFLMLMIYRIIRLMYHFCNPEFKNKTNNNVAGCSRRQQGRHSGGTSQHRRTQRGA